MVVWLYQWLLPAMLSMGKPAPHPFYVSVTEINYNAQEKTWEGSVKLFADDLEATLRKQSGTPVDLSAETQKQKATAWLSQYLAAHLSLKSDGKRLPFQFLGFEKEKEAAYCYFEIAQAVVPKKLDITNTILYEAHPEQINIMHLTVGGKRQSTKLTNPVKDASFNF